MTPARTLKASPSGLAAAPVTQARVKRTRYAEVLRCNLP